MPIGLKRYQQSGQTHFINFSCYHRIRHLENPALADTFVLALERIRRRYGILIFGFVVMPEHVHLLISEPSKASLATAIQGLKISVARHAFKAGASPLWQKRYFDHNVRTHTSFINKLQYIHRNPVKRGLCKSPMDWKWSSYRHYATAEAGTVAIESEWTAHR